MGFNVHYTKKEYPTKAEAEKARDVFLGMYGWGYSPSTTLETVDKADPEGKTILHTSRSDSCD